MQAKFGMALALTLSLTLTLTLPLGGAFYLSGSTARLSDSRITRGEASGRGGALLLAGASEAELVRCTLNGSSAAVGGALAVLATTTAPVGSGRLDSVAVDAPPTLRLQHVLLAGNAASGSGGAVNPNPNPKP